MGGMLSRYFSDSDENEDNGRFNGDSSSARSIQLKSPVADSNLGELTPMHMRVGKAIMRSASIVDCPGGLENLWTASTFIFNRKNPRTRDGFGFHCEITVINDNEGGKYVALQQTKPKSKREMTLRQDGPIDIFEDAGVMDKRQVLGIMFKKAASATTSAPPSTDSSLSHAPSSYLEMFQSADLFSLQGLSGSILVKGDWTSSYEIRNAEDQVILLAQRFNRISGGLEFQILSTDEFNAQHTICVATFLRLEESKFILKLYTAFSPVAKALQMSFALFVIYLFAR